MVQLNPLKWGSKKKKENLKIAGLQKTASSSTIGRSASNRRIKAKNELNKMGVLTDKQKTQKDQKDRKAYDQANRIVNKRGRVTGYKEGYDPSKGVQKNKPNNKTSTSKSKGKGGGVTINGKPPTSIQKKLLAGGWSAKELEAKINARKKKK